MMLLGRARAPRGSAALGVWGERFVRRQLKRQGWRFVARNVSCRGGEIDLIMVNPEGILVFLEVKTRRREDFQPTETVVTFAKQRRMRSATRYFLSRHDLGDRACRFDVVIVVAGDRGRPDMRHYPAAFSFS
jgi:putative endonuclease